MSEENLKVQINRFKTADVEREVLKLATMASNITFVQQLIEKLDELEKQLNEANEVIKFYSDAHKLSEEEKQMTGEKYHLVYGLKAIDYLEKLGVK